MKGIIAKKIGMTRIFNEKGVCIPVTILEAGPCKIIRIKNREKDGYNAIQVGFGKINLTKLNKPVQGQLKKQGLEEGYRYIKEFRTETIDEYKVGEEIKATVFKSGDIVDVVGISKGKGFAGVVKRYHFHGGPASHGSMSHRRPGSIGTNTFPGRVLKNKKLPGHMGVTRVTVKNLKIYSVIEDKNLILIKGAVPGANNGIVMVRQRDQVAR